VGASRTPGDSRAGRAGPDARGAAGARTAPDGGSPSGLSRIDS
jgi:hypothetical protein